MGSCRVPKSEKESRCPPTCDKYIFDDSKLISYERCLCNVIYLPFGGWAKTVLLVSFPGTISDVDNMECVRPIDWFMHIYCPRKMKCTSLAWHFLIEL